jgi:hypothetical protein
MIKCTRIDEDHVTVELEGNGKDIFSEMCILFADLRKKYKPLYLSALKYARLTNLDEESEEDA